MHPFVIFVPSPVQKKVRRDVRLEMIDIHEDFKDEVILRCGHPERVTSTFRGHTGRPLACSHCMQIRQDPGDIQELR